MSKYANIQWVVQRNLTEQASLHDLESACNATNVDYCAIEVIPFSDHLFEFPRLKKSIFYGSTTTMYLIYQQQGLNQGLFFDETAFSMERYLDVWGKYMLNFGSRLIKVGDLNTLDYVDDKLLFIRPNDDSKSFSGEVKRFGEIADWMAQIGLSEDMSVTADTKILVGEPYHIKSEWRLWIVEKQVVAASKYRENFKLKKERGCPDAVRNFAEARCIEYTPHDVFVIDIGLCGEDLYIIECGCMNSAGFYDADIDNIVQNVTEYFHVKYS